MKIRILPSLTALFVMSIPQISANQFNLAPLSTFPLVKQQEPVDTLSPTLNEFATLQYHKTEELAAAPGTKSVLFNSRGNKLYAMNLEGMSIYEFDQATRKIDKELKFRATPATGWDYENEKAIQSFEEKPVEACLSHDDKWLWVSLHNAEGIVAIRIDSLAANLHLPAEPLGWTYNKRISVITPGAGITDSFYVPLIHTGKTPKIIARTADNNHLLVSNWHSNNVSILQTNMEQYPYAYLIESIKVPAIPRGVVVDDKRNISYIAIMGGASLMEVENKSWKKLRNIPVLSNPRHIVLDNQGRLFVSYNKIGKIACIDPETGNTLFTASTPAQPRTIMLSRNHQFLFVTCYSSNRLEVFRINKSSFTRVASLPCPGHPVGVDIFEDEKTLEAWVCSYTTGRINIFSFLKN